jgi:arylamine N-acetyltransferase
VERDPLAVPAPDSRAAGAFLHHFGIDAGPPSADLLSRVARAFARLPYENLSKILKQEREGRCARARRHAEEVIVEHTSMGTGGTCFSLTATLLHVLRAIGFRAEPILADRRYGENTHSALVVWVDGRPCLLDPGYLIVDPIALDDGGDGERRIATEFNELVLTPREGGSRLDLETLQQGSRSYRLTFKTDPADRDEFLRAWDASFDWDMMRYPLLTRVVDGRQLYLQARRFQTRNRDGVERRDVDPSDLAREIATEFGLDASVAARALAVLDRRGEGDARAPRP